MQKEKVRSYIIENEEFIVLSDNWILTISGMHLEDQKSISYVRFSLSHNLQDNQYFINFIDANTYCQTLFSFFISSKKSINSKLNLKKILHLKCYSHSLNEKRTSAYLRYTNRLSNDIYIEFTNNQIQIYFNNNMFYTVLDSPKTYLLFKAGGFDHFLLRDIYKPNVYIEFTPTTFDWDTDSYNGSLTSVMVIASNGNKSYIEEVSVNQISDYLSTIERCYATAQSSSKKTAVCKFEMVSKLNATYDSDFECSLTKWLLLRSVYQFLFEDLKVQLYPLYT